MLSTVWNTQRGSWSYTEKRRERKEIEVTRRGGEVKRREIDPANNQFPKCSQPSGTHRESQIWVEKRRGRKEIEATWWRKRRSKGGKRNQASDLSPK